MIASFKSSNTSLFYFIIAICNLQFVQGPCKTLMHHEWGYNSTEGDCVLFKYGGCEGNENRFWTKKECEDACV